MMALREKIVSLQNMTYSCQADVISYKQKIEDFENKGGTGMAVNILDRSYEPSIKEMGEYIEGDLSKTFEEMIALLERNFKAKSKIDYSVCQGQPGWNLKYKKSGKALCTLYPEKDFFIMLIVLGTKDRELFDIIREDFCGYIQELYDSVRLFNGTKWLMIHVTSELIAEDARKLIELKLKK